MPKSKQEKMRFSKPILFPLCFLLLFCSPSFTLGIPIQEEQKQDIPSIDDFHKKHLKSGGFFPLYRAAKPSSKIWMEIPIDGEDILFNYGLATGLGSNPIGLDRGKLGRQHVVEFRLIGDRVMMIEKNLRYRSTSKNPLERIAVEQSFASSILWSQKVAAKSGDKVVLEVSSLMNKDWNGVAKALASTGGGPYKLDTDRCFVYLQRTKAFPNNTELESWQTYESSKPGSDVRQTAPSGNSVSLRSHLSFVKLPDRAYRPRKFDIRCPSMYTEFADYSSPIDAPLETRWIHRHRLQKIHPRAQKSRPKEPIVYYVDSGAPKEIQDALIEGASWWNEAFEEAGFQNAFIVKPMPDGMDPMDCRYNVIQWVHRSTRGWSYGGSVIDPRTGEIIKGHVSLGSLRVRQDRLIFEGATAPFGNSNSASHACAGMIGLNSDTALAFADPDRSPKEIALSRIRQLAAHEVGHTLGFVHNFAGSTYGNRASVMDYPAPKFGLKNGKIDLSDAYGIGIGSWDKFGVAYAYSQFPPGADEEKELEKLIQDSIRKKMLFLSDGEARPANASDPQANLWDNGSDPTEELLHLLDVRKVALKDFGLSSLPAGSRVSELEEAFVPIYLMHRFQIEATAKIIGGVRFRFAKKGDGQIPTQPVPAKDQQIALETLVKVLSPENLSISRELAKNFPPSRISTVRKGETFGRKTSPIFDRIGAAEVIVDMVLEKVLNTNRINRLLDQTENGWDADKFVTDIVKKTLANYSESSSVDQVRLSQMIRLRLFHYLVKLHHSEAATPGAVSAAEAGLHALRGFQIQNGKISKLPTGIRRSETLFRLRMQRKFQKFWKRDWKEENQPRSQQPRPAGSPIGQ